MQIVSRCRLYPDAWSASFKSAPGVVVALELTRVMVGRRFQGGSTVPRWTVESGHHGKLERAHYFSASEAKGAVRDALARTWSETNEAD